jgi:CheY-like chemotaxis protein
MNEKTLRLLVLEDNRDDAEMAIKQLEREGFEIEHSIVDKENSFREALDTDPDLILADYSLPGFNCVDALLIQQKVSPDIPLILLSGTIGEEKAADCIKLGAVDYVLKDNLVRLGPAVQRALDEAELRRERMNTERKLRESEAQKQALLDGSPDMIILLDTELKVVWANRTALNMNPDSVGQFCYRAFPGFEEPCKDCPIEKSIKTGKNEIGVMCIPAIEGIKGKSYWEDIGVPVKNGNGNVIEVIKIARNITDRVKREKELKRKNEELERFNSLAVGREVKMVELKREINSLLEELGREHRFSLPEGSETEVSR